MRTTASEDTASQAADYFKDNIATYETVKMADGTDLEHLVWQRSDGTITGQVNYYMHHGSLMITGDWHHATLDFNRKWTLRDVADCDLYYFMRNMKAGPHGREGQEWSPEAASKVLDHIFSEKKMARQQGIQDEAEDRATRDIQDLAEVDEEIWERTFQKHLAIVEAEVKSKEDSEYSHLDDPYQHIGYESEWEEFLSSQGASVLGDDCWEYCNIGQTTAHCHVYQFVGLQQAMRKLGPTKE